MIKINRGRINLALSSLAFTISSAGSVLLHIVFAIAIYSETGSGLLTSLFISLQWLPMLIVILYRSDWDHGMNPRKRWILLDCVSALLTLPILFFVGSGETNYLLIVFILLIRGIVDQISRINKTVIARFIFPAGKVTHYASFMQTGYHFGIGLAAITGILIAEHINLRTVVIIDVVTFLTASLLVYFVHCTEEVDFPESVERQSLSKRFTEYMSSLSSDARLLFCAVLPPLTATFFQGTYSVLQPIFPIEHFSLGSSAVSATYVIASIAIVLGSSGFSLYCKKSKLFERDFSNTIYLTMAASIGACLVYMLSVSTGSIIVSALCFALMVFLFEFTWMTGYGGIVAFAPKNQLGSVFGISFAIGCLLGSVAAALTGALLDLLGNNFLFTIGVFMTTYMAILLLTWSMYRKFNMPAEVENLAGQSI